MATTIKLRRTDTPNNPPPTLNEGELALGLGDTPKRLWVGTAGGVEELLAALGGPYLPLAGGTLTPIIDGAGSGTGLTISNSSSSLFSRSIDLTNSGQGSGIWLNNTSIYQAGIFIDTSGGAVGIQVIDSVTNTRCYIGGDWFGTGITLMGNWNFGSDPISAPIVVFDVKDFGRAGNLAYFQLYSDGSMRITSAVGDVHFAINGQTGAVTMSTATINSIKAALGI